MKLHSHGAHRAARTALAALLLAGVSLAGCTSADEDGGSGTVSLTFVDDAPSDISLLIAGAWLQAEAGAWHRFVPAGTLVALSGGGQDTGVSGSLEPGHYSGLRVVFSAASVDGVPASLATTGLEVEIQVDIDNGDELALTLTFDWDASLFDAANGTMAIEPTIATLAIVRNGEPLRTLEGTTTAAATLPPVARVTLIGADDAPLFAADFEAADTTAEAPIIAPSGRLKLLASASEALEPTAEIAAYRWVVDGVEAGSNGSLDVTFPLVGGRSTIRLTVTDSLGVSDSQTLHLVLQPGKAVAVRAFNGTVTDLRLADGTYVNGGPLLHTVAVNESLPDGTPVRVSRIEASLGLTGGGAPVGNNIDLLLRDPNGEEAANATSDGSDEHLSAVFDPGATVGTWTLEVHGVRSYESQYAATVTLHMVAVNPEIEQFLASYSDGHDHQH